MSTNRGAREISMKGDQPREKILALRGDKENHYQWSPIVTTYLQSKGWWHGVVVGVDDHTLQAAMLHFQKAELGCRDPDSNSLLQALAFGDTVSQASEMARVALSPPRVAAPGARRTPPRQAGAFTPRRPIQQRFQYSSARREMRSQVDSDAEDEFDDPNEDSNELDKFLRKNASAMHVIKSSIDEGHKLQFIKTSLSAVLWEQLKPEQRLDGHLLLADQGRKLDLKDPRHFESYLRQIYALQAKMLQVKDPTRSEAQREVDLFGYALAGLDWNEFKDLHRFFSRSTEPRTIQTFSMELREHCNVAIRYNTQRQESANYGTPPPKNGSPRKDKGPKDKKFKGTCFKCGKEGHRQAECRSKGDAPTAPPDAEPSTDGAAAGDEEKNRRDRRRKPREINCMMVTATSMDAGMDDKEALRLHIVGMLESLGKGGTTSNGGEPTETQDKRPKTISVNSPMAYHQVDPASSTRESLEEGNVREDGQTLDNTLGAPSPIAKWETLDTHISAANQGKTGKSGSNSSSHQGLPEEWQVRELIRVLVPEEGVQNTSISTATSPAPHEWREPRNPIGPNFWAGENSNRITALPLDKFFTRDGREGADAAGNTPSFDTPLREGEVESRAALSETLVIFDGLSDNMTREYLAAPQPCHPTPDFSESPSTTVCGLQQGDGDQLGAVFLQTFNMLVGETGAKERKETTSLQECHPTLDFSLVAGVHSGGSSEPQGETASKHGATSKADARQAGQREFDPHLGTFFAPSTARARPGRTSTWGQRSVFPNRFNSPMFCLSVGGSEGEQTPTMAPARPATTAKAGETKAT